MRGTVSNTIPLAHHSSVAEGVVGCYSISSVLDTVSIPAFKLLLTICNNNMSSENEKLNICAGHFNRTRNMGICAVSDMKAKLHPYELCRDSFMFTDLF